jgi:hypothetical protein
MLLTNIKVEDIRCTRHRVSMKVRRLTPGPVANYHCIAGGRKIILQSYPRWAERTVCMVARGAALLCLDELLPAGKDIVRFNATVNLVTGSRETPLVELRFQQNELEILDKGPPESMTSLHLAPEPNFILSCLRHAAWQENKEPPLPLPPSPPLRDRYIRLSDLGEPARSGLASAIHQYGWGQPDFPSEGECVWIRDWQRFICG